MEANKQNINKYCKHLNQQTNLNMEVIVRMHRRYCTPYHTYNDGDMHDVMTSGALNLPHKSQKRRKFFSSIANHGRISCEQHIVRSRFTPGSQGAPYY